MGTFLYQHYPKAKRYGRFPRLFCHHFLRSYSDSLFAAVKTAVALIFVFAVKRKEQEWKERVKIQLFITQRRYVIFALSLLCL